MAGQHKDKKTDRRHTCANTDCELNVSLIKPRVKPFVHAVDRHAQVYVFISVSEFLCVCVSVCVCVCVCVWCVCLCVFSPKNKVSAPVTPPFAVRLN